ncbi:hypothetical protein DTO166G5_6401 [Paecilomyces variotii]|nr:hypothetical protein DTO166G5_6401 [Paecilomyces variotii]
MPINRLRRRLPSPYDPELCCVLCGLVVPMSTEDPDVTHEREDWKAMAEKLRPVPFVVLDDPKKNQLRISGISRGYFGGRDPDIDDCYENGVYWLKRQSDPTKPMKIRGRHGDEEPGTTHWPANPLRILDIQKLIERVTQSHDTVMKPDIRKPRRLAKAADLPLDIAVVIINIIYKSQPHSRERIEDTRNILDAFEWKLPNAYWQSRCNPELVFEVGDLIRAEHVVDWANFCLGLEELLLDKDWYCNSGLNNRGRTLKLIAAIKKRFDKAIKQENGIVEPHNG